MFEHSSPGRRKESKQQLVRFNDRAELLFSDENLFGLSDKNEGSFLDRFPFIESIFSSLFDPATDQTEWLFRAVETVHDDLPGFYDYHFQRLLIDGQIVIEWTITDRTDFYNYFRQDQQRRNDEHLKS